MIAITLGNTVLRKGIFSNSLSHTNGKNDTTGIHFELKKNELHKRSLRKY
jgi:hypothetical protein